MPRGPSQQCVRQRRMSGVEQTDPKPADSRDSSLPDSKPAAALEAKLWPSGRMGPRSTSRDLRGGSGLEPTSHVLDPGLTAPVTSTRAVKLERLCQGPCEHLIAALHLRGRRTRVSKLIKRLWSHRVGPTREPPPICAEASRALPRLCCGACRPSVLRSYPPPVQKPRTHRPLSCKGRGRCGAHLGFGHRAVAVVHGRMVRLFRPSRSAFIRAGKAP